MRRYPTRRETLAAAAVLASGVARAGGGPLRLSHGYSIGYLPLMVMRDRKLIEAHAARAGLGELALEWRIADGGNNINDAMLAGALDIAGTGIPGYLVLRDRTRGKRQEVTSISSLTTGSLWLNTTDPRIKTLADYGPGDRIAVPGIKTSYAAIVLEMAVAKVFGIENYAKLDPITVGMPHPEAYAAMMSGKTEIRSHLASAPFSYQELKNPAVHRVLSTKEFVGPMSILLLMTPLAFATANPALMQVVLAAQEEAVASIQGDPDGAVTSYLRATELQVPRAELLQMLADPENGYSVVPDGSLTYANFLAETGVIKTKPASWTELFLPLLRDRAGS